LAYRKKAQQLEKQMDTDSIKERTARFVTSQENVDFFIDAFLELLGLDSEDILSETRKLLPDNMVDVTITYFLDEAKLKRIEANLKEGEPNTVFH
jgi:hypothetical protein